MNVLELFAGAGGGTLASKLLGHRIVCAVERDPYCREVLLRRQEEGALEPFPIWDDVHTFDGRPWHGLVDVVSGGFPCQPFSVASKRRAGADDERNLWPATLRVIGEVRPSFAFLENVAGIVQSYLPVVIGDLAELGYDAEWGVLGAGDVGAPHQRDRVWVLAADSKRVRVRQQPGWSGWASRTDPIQLEWNGTTRELANPKNNGAGRRAGISCHAGIPGVFSWHSEPNVGRVADGVAYRVDRLRALGNGQVPQCYAEAFRQLYARMIGK